MNKYEKEVQKQLLANEKKILKELEKNYTDALVTIKSRISELMNKGDELTQSQIYQLNFQRNLEKQVSSVIELLKNDITSNTNTYLTTVYENSFIGEAYNFSKAYNMNLFIGIDQQSVVKSVEKSIDNMTFAERTNVNMNDFKKKIKNEISRGFSTSMTYSEMARNISLVAERDMYKAYRIARTEGLRVQSESRLDYGKSLKEKYGADLVKEWDSTLDGKVRPEHQELDGQIKELDEDFECSGGNAKAPGLFGNPAMDCNCRCCVLEKPRWAVDIPLTKIDSANSFKNDGTVNLIDGKNYEEYKKNYYKYLNNKEKDDTIFSNKNKEVEKLYYIGKLDITKLGKYKNKITTDEVVLTDERKLHIKEDHANDYETIISNIDRVVLNPDEIIEDIKNEDTIMYIGKLTKNNLNVIVKLNTIDSKEHPQNSVMTAWIIRNKNLDKLREKNKILYKKE